MSLISYNSDSQNWTETLHQPDWIYQIWKTQPVTGRYGCMAGGATNLGDTISPGSEFDHGFYEDFNYAVYGLDGNDKFRPARIGKRSTAYLIGGTGRDELTGFFDKSTKKQWNNNIQFVLTDSYSTDLISNYNPEKNKIAIANNVFYDRWLDYSYIPPTLFTKYSSRDLAIFVDTDNSVAVKSITQKQGSDLLPQEVLVLHGRTFDNISGLDTSSWSKTSHLAWIGSGKSYEVHLDVDGNWGSLEDQHLLAVVKGQKAFKLPNLTFGLAETDAWTECPQARNPRPIILQAK